MGEMKTGKEEQNNEKGFYISEPFVSRSIEPKDPSLLGRLGAVLRKWQQADPTLTIRKDEDSGKYLLSGIDPLQLEMLINQIQEEIPVIVGIPTTIYYETVFDKSIEVNTRCSERLNELKLYIEPLNVKTLQLLRGGKIHEKQDREELGAYLGDAGWDRRETRDIWAIEGANILTNLIGEAQRLDRIRNSIISTFRDFCKGSALAKEPALGLKVVITDAIINEDPSHTRSAQIFVMTFSALNTGFLTANPGLLEPILKFDLKTPPEFLGKIKPIITEHRGKILKTVQSGNIVEVQGEIPASESLKLDGRDSAVEDETRTLTQGKASFSYQFLKFKLIPENLQEGKIFEIKRRKQGRGARINLEFPRLSDALPLLENGDKRSWKSRIKKHLKKLILKLIIKRLLDELDDEE